MLVNLTVPVECGDEHCWDCAFLELHDDSDAKCLLFNSLLYTEEDGTEVVQRCKQCREAENAD